MKKMYRYKDGNTLVNVSSSILKYFGVSPQHKTYEPLDKLLEKNKDKKIVLFLFDAMGKKTLTTYKYVAPFIYKHKFQTVSAVFPPTTAASTTSICNALYPSETGWIGWWAYLNGTLCTSFSSQIYNSEEFMSPTIVETLKYSSIFEQINEKNGADIACSVQSFALKDPSMKGLIDEVERKLPDKKYIYAYLTEPDHYMHTLGEINDTTKGIIADIDNQLKNFVERHKDVLILSLADHDMKNTVPVEYHQDIFDLAKNHIFSIEPRAATFFVDKDKHELFYNLLKEYYEDDFDIYTKQEVIDLELFGPKETRSPYFDKLLGDFLLVSTGDKVFTFPNGEALFANHAGGTEEESLIYLSKYNF